MIVKITGDYFKSLLWKIRQYLSYYRSAQTIYDLHSPALFRYLEFVTDPSRKYYGMARLRPLRDIINRKYRDDKQDIADPLVSELRENTRPFLRKGRKQSDRKVIHCLFRSVVYLRSRKILHIGAGNGLDSLFLKIAAGNDSELYLTDQHPSMMRTAHRYFKWFGKSFKKADINAISNNVDTDDNKFDLIVFGCSTDASKVTKATLDKIANLSRPGASWLMLSPNRDPENKKLWDYIKQHSFSRATLDCWSFGAAFGSHAFQQKTDFSYISWIRKPWRIGLWPRTGVANSP